MDSDQHIETENDEKQQQLSYRYENPKENEYKPKQYNSIEVSESGGDIMKKINEAADNLESIIDKNDLKIFSKYEDLNEEQLKKLLEEKSENLIKLNKQKDDSKIKLSNLLKELNKTITDNTEILYKEKPEPETIYNLQKEIENKKKELKVVKNMNHSCKCQYNAINNKLNKKNNKNNDNNGETQISNLKNENKKLQIDIRRYKDESITKKKDVKNIVDNKIFPNMMKIKAEEIRNLTNSKHKYYTKIKDCMKSLDNVIKEIYHLEDISNQKFKEEGDENLNNKINFWINLIKSDLSGTQDEIISKIEKKESKFLNELKKTDFNNNKVKSSSFDENIKENNNNVVKSSNLNFSQRKNKISNLNNINLKNSHKGIFGKFNYLKQKPNSSINKYKLSSINLSSEEIKINNYKSTCNNIDIDNIIQKDYEDTTDSEYRELLDKKSQYLETNMRLEKNIKEIERTKKTKLLNISYTVQENEQKLKELKAQNDLLEQEIVNLQNLYQLTIDKERLKQEIKEKEKKKIIEENNKKKENLVGDKSKMDNSNTENIILNELKESNDSLKKSKKNEEKKKMNKNKNKSGYADDFLPNENVIESREERLQKIKKKYLDENLNEEINENNNEENNLDIVNNENQNQNDKNEIGNI